MRFQARASRLSAALFFAASLRNLRLVSAKAAFTADRCCKRASIAATTEAAKAHNNWPANKAVKAGNNCKAKLATDHMGNARTLTGVREHDRSPRKIGLLSGITVLTLSYLILSYLILYLLKSAI